MATCKRKKGGFRTRLEGYLGGSGSCLVWSTEGYLVSDKGRLANDGVLEGLYFSSRHGLGGGAPAAMKLAPPAPNSPLDSPQLSPRPDARDTQNIARVASHALSFSGSDSETAASPSRYSNNASPAASQHSGVASVSPARSASAKLATLAALGLVHGPLPASVSTPACSATEESDSGVEGRMQLGNGGSWSASASVHALAPNAAPSGEAAQRRACCAAESAQASAEASTRLGLRAEVCARTCCKRFARLLLGVEGLFCVQLLVRHLQATWLANALPTLQIGFFSAAGKKLTVGVTARLVQTGACSAHPGTSSDSAASAAIGVDRGYHAALPFLERPAAVAASHAGAAAGCSSAGGAYSTGTPMSHSPFAAAASDTSGNGGSTLSGASESGASGADSGCCAESSEERARVHGSQRLPASPFLANQARSLS